MNRSADDPSNSGNGVQVDPTAGLHSHAAALPETVRELSIEVATTLSELQRLKPDYERLHRIAANTSPFALLDWHMAWCEHFLNLDPHVRDDIMVLVLRDPRADCVAIVPLIVSARRFGPLNVVSIELLGADPSTTETRTPLVAPGYEALTVRAVRRRLAQRQDWDWITWGGVDEKFGQELAMDANLHMQPEAPGYMLDLPSTWPEFRSGLKRNIRESLRHGYNSLKRGGHTFSLEVATEPAAVHRGIERFLMLHSSRAHMTGTIEHPDHFAGQASKRFLFAVCATLSARGIVRVFQLRIGTEVVAIRIGFVVGDGLYLYYSGFDPRWARYGVMTTALAESLKYAIAQGLKTVNLSRGTDPSKTRWSPRAIKYSTVLELRRRPTSRVAHRCYLSARSGKGLQFWILRFLGRSRRVWD